MSCMGTAVPVTGTSDPLRRVSHLRRVVGTHAPPTKAHAKPVVAFAQTRAVGLASSPMPTGRMNREQFFGKLVALDEQRLKKALWNLY
jgi:hypothetical protein